MGCRQRGKGSPGWEGKSCQFASQPWPHGSHHPCALHCSLQLPLATVWQSLFSPWFAHQHQKTEVAPAVPARERLAHNSLPASTAPVLTAGREGCQPPTFHSSQPRSWQVGLWLQDRCRCLSWGCRLHPLPGWGTGRHPLSAGGHPGAMHTSRVCSGPCCSCSAHPALDFALHPTTSLPICLKPFIPPI